MAEFEGRVREIFAEGKNYAVLSIPRKDGTVQSVVVWANVEGDALAVNSAEGRSWPANLRAAKTATVTAFADGNPYEWASVTGSLALDTHDGADAHIDALANKYIGQDYPYREPGEQRVKFTLAPERVTYVKQG
jgi:PPOX class probable F420-dependent enzyme